MTEKDTGRAGQEESKLIMSNAVANGLAGAGGGIIAQIITYPLQTVPNPTPLSLIVHCTSHHLLSSGIRFAIPPVDTLLAGEYASTDGESGQERVA